MEHIKESIETFLSLFIPKGALDYVLASVDAIGVFLMIQITNGNIHTINLLLESCVEIVTIISILVTIIIKVLKYRKGK